MLVFVDESGDPGLKLTKGSSQHFVVGLIVFEDHDEAENCDKRIALLRSELGLVSNYEFRFNRCNETIRKQFLKAVAPYSFFYYGIVIKKAKLYGPGFKYKEPFYKYVTGLVFENAKSKLTKAIVVIDGSGSKDFRYQLQKYLKGKVNDRDSTAIRKVKVQNSNGNNLIQLADMVTGSIYRSVGTKPGGGSYRKLIAHREIYVQTWPK